MPLHAVANTLDGLRRSTVSVMTSESSIMPFEIGYQVRPPSRVFQGRCHVPAYSVSAAPGSNASDPTFLRSMCPSGLMRRQDLPPSPDRNTPLSVPAARTLGADGAWASARTACPAMPGSSVNVWPPSVLLATPPPSFVSTVQ